MTHMVMEKRENQTETTGNVAQRYETMDLLKLPGEGEQTETDMMIKARARDMGGDFSVMQGVINPHELLAPHTHKFDDQLVFVITSELEFEVGGEDGIRFTAPAGSYVQKPRGIQHCFWNATDQPAQYIELSGRHRFEGFIDSFQQGSLKASKNAESDWGMIFHSERIPKLMRDNNLTGLSNIETPDLSSLPEPIARLFKKDGN